MGRAGRRDLLDLAAGGAIVLLGGGALYFAVQLGTAAGVSEGDLLADLRARSEKRFAQERSQIGPLVDLAARGRYDDAIREGELILLHAGGNSQLLLLLADGYRARGEAAPALRSYRRAVELSREYTDRRSPFYLGDGFRSWIRGLKPQLARAAAAPGAQAALRDLYFLERSLAGGCT